MGKVVFLKSNFEILTVLVNKGIGFIKYAKRLDYTTSV